MPEARSLFQTGGQESIGPRPFTSFLDRLSSPVDKIAVKVAGDNLAADGISGTDVQVRLLDRDFVVDSEALAVFAALAAEAGAEPASAPNGLCLRAGAGVDTSRRGLSLLSRGRLSLAGGGAMAVLHNTGGGRRSLSTRGAGLR